MPQNHMLRLTSPILVNVPMAIGRIFLAGLLTNAWIVSSSAEEAVPVRLKSEITQIQPMTGIVLWSDNPTVETQANAISLEYRYCGYNEIVQPDGTYDFRKLDAVLDQIANRNHQAVLRFYFCYVGKKTTVPDYIRNHPKYQETVGRSEGEKTHFCDWSNQELQDFVLDFYTRFAKRYDQDRRIAFLQTGFGLWAEYHIYDGPRKLGSTFPDKQYQAKFLRHLDKQFTSLPWSISVDAADSTYSPIEDNQELLSLDFGVFDDSFLCEPHPKENAVNWKILDTDRWKRQPGGGELSYYTQKDQQQALAPDGPYGISFETAAEKFHISYMIGNDQPQYQKINRIRSASKATGYRFRVTAAHMVGSKLRLTVTNEGVSPLYRDAYFVIGNKRCDRSLRGLLPTEERTFEINQITNSEIGELRIHSDHILPAQVIEFAADLP